MTQLADDARWRTPEEVAQELCVGHSTVMKWIRKGELFAVNASEDQRSKRPRYRVSPQSIREFLDRRAVAAEAGSDRGRRGKVRKPSQEWF